MPPAPKVLSPSLQGKSVLITGGARRLGRAMALELAAAGANVAITYRESSREAYKTLRDIVVNDVQSLAVRCDVREEKSIRVALKQVVKEFGGLDVLINNAGIYESIPPEKITVQQWDNMFAINTRAPYLVSRACIPYLRRRKGRIINIGSLGGMHAWVTHAHYCQSKAALHMQTQILAKALAPAIAVNCVAPGMIEMGDAKSGSLTKRLQKKTAMHRNGTPEDVAAAVLFFAAAPRFITGQILVVDGGLGLP